MHEGMLQAVFMFSPVDNNQGNASRRVQMPWMINGAGGLNSAKQL